MPVAIANAIANCNFVALHNKLSSKSLVAAVAFKVEAVAVVAKELASKVDTEHSFSDF